MNTSQYIMKAAMLADRGLLDRAIEAARQGLSATVSEAREVEMIEKMELKLLLAELLGCSGRRQEAIAIAGEVRRAAASCELDGDLTAPLLDRVADILRNTRET